MDQAGFVAAEGSATLEGLLVLLSERERVVLPLRFAQDLTQTEIGEVVGVSQMKVSRMIRRALGELQDAANRDGPGG